MNGRHDVCHIRKRLRYHEVRWKGGDIVARSCENKRMEEGFPIEFEESEANRAITLDEGKVHYWGKISYNDQRLIVPLQGTCGRTRSPTFGGLA